NGSCTFSVAACINQTDPNLSACQPPTGLQKLFVNPPKLAGAVPGSLDGPACGSFVAIPLPLNNGTQPAMVRLSANATAANGTSPRRDRDTYVLECLPRTTPCPTTSTTTTTTSSTTTLPSCGQHAVSGITSCGCSNCSISACAGGFTFADNVTCAQVQSRGCAGGGAGCVAICSADCSDCTTGHPCMGPTTTTTSTTTTSTSSTTTTTICPNTCLNGGTLNPDCSCTCPSGYDSVHGGCFQVNNSMGNCGSSCDAGALFHVHR